MAQFFDFMGNHPFLFGLLGLFITLFIVVDGKSGGKKIAPNDLGLFVNQNKARIIDIRPAVKFASAHIKGSQNISFTEIAKRAHELKADPTPIIFVCDMGLQASAAAKLIARDDVYRLDGGFNAWQAAGLPVAKGAAAL